jgi:hypothetical protein
MTTLEGKPKCPYVDNCAVGDFIKQHGDKVMGTIALFRRDLEKQLTRFEDNVEEAHKESHDEHLVYKNELIFLQKTLVGVVAFCVFGLCGLFAISLLRDSTKDFYAKVAGQEVRINDNNK